MEQKLDILEELKNKNLSFEWDKPNTILIFSSKDEFHKKVATIDIIDQISPKSIEEHKHFLKVSCRVLDRGYKAFTNASFHCCLTRELLTMCSNIEGKNILLYREILNLPCSSREFKIVIDDEPSNRWEFKPNNELSEYDII